MLTLLITIVLAVLAAGFGFRTARNLVRDRLRYVDAAASPAAPWVAGALATCLGAFIALFLPFVGATVALAFGASVTAGVLSGQRAVRTGSYLVTDGK